MHERRSSHKTSKTPSLHAHLTVNGWQFVTSKRMCHDVTQSHYKHPVTGWTAREMHRGPNNIYMGLLVSDEQGRYQGLVAHVTDLP